MSDPGTNLEKIKHIVVVMLENRSFDHFLGWLYTESGNLSPLGQPFDGLTGAESNPYDKGRDGNGQAVPVSRLQPGVENLYYMPGADPGEGFKATNSQLFGSIDPKDTSDPTNQGFVNDFHYTLGWEGREGWQILPGTEAQDIMACHTPETLPVLSTLARQYAVCDHWFASVPTETLPNRAFMHMATSLGRLNDDDRRYDAPSIFNLMEDAGLSWAIYGYESPPLSRSSVAQITDLSNDHFGEYEDFQAALDAGTLADYVFLEPSWGKTGNSAHPNYDVAKAEAFLAKIYDSLAGSSAWQDTLLIITFDEHGGCYDHVAPPGGAAPPGPTTSSSGEVNSGLSEDPPFGFDRFGVRVPTVLVSPWIEAGTVHRVPAGETPFDHTSILKTLELKHGLTSLTQRDAAAYHLADVLSLTTARSDNVLAGVTPPTIAPAVTTEPWRGHEGPSHLQLVHADSLADQGSGPDSSSSGKPETEEETDKLIRSRYESLHRAS